mgnify:CR=1 FL=1
MGSVEILIVEDDAEMAEVLCQGFEQEDYVVFVARNGCEAVRMASGHAYEAMVLDVMLPGLDGFEVAAELRQAGNRIPILMLTARDSLTDIVRGLDCGAEDYLTKPFSFLELAARVRALIRRNQPAESRWQVGDLTLDAASHRVARGGRPIPLSKAEFRALETLVRNGGRVVSRGELREAIWGPSWTVDNNSLDVIMSSLRGKVGKPEEAKLIHTVRGFGYRIGVS